VSEHSANSLLRKSFTDFLSRDTFAWDCFGTFTFARARTQRTIDSLANLLRSLHRSRGGWYRAFIAEERGPGGGRLHLHALVEHPGRTIWDLKRDWQRKSGTGGAFVREFDPSLGAAYYVTKYIIKDVNNLGDWDLVDYGEKKADFLWTDNGLTVDRHRLYSETVRLTKGPGAE